MDESASEGLDRKLIVLLFGGILCLGMALGLELFAHVRKPQRAARLAATDARFNDPVTLPAQPHALTFGELRQILSARRGEPAASRFSASFMGRAALRKIYEEFDAGPASRPAAEFVAALQRSLEFGELLRGSSRDPEFRASADQVVRHPEIARLLKGLAAPGEAAAALPAAAPSGVVADTVGAETFTSPVGPVQAPGQPVP